MKVTRGDRCRAVRDERQPTMGRKQLRLIAQRQGHKRAMAGGAGQCTRQEGIFKA
jgi:hypothetical protein